MVRVPRSRGRSCSQTRTQELGLRNCGPPWATGLPWGQESRPNPVFKQIAPSFTVLMNTFGSRSVQRQPRVWSISPHSCFSEFQGAAPHSHTCQNFLPHLFFFKPRNPHFPGEANNIHDFLFQGGEKVFSRAYWFIYIQRLPENTPVWCVFAIFSQILTHSLEDNDWFFPTSQSGRALFSAQGGACLRPPGIAGGALV